LLVRLLREAILRDRAPDSGVERSHE
jgi:hypothetical protein